MSATVDAALTLRDLTAQDAAIIKNWPPYPAGFAALDYALRENGWLDEFSGRIDVWRFAFWRENELIAFSLLIKTCKKEAEFRIALRADALGLGLSRRVAALTVDEGFSRLGLLKIHLIVRKNNLRAIRLYESMGFTPQGECVKNVNNEPVCFNIMVLHTGEFNKG